MCGPFVYGTVGLISTHPPVYRGVFSAGEYHLGPQLYLAAFGRFVGITLRKKWYLLYDTVATTIMITKSDHWEFFSQPK